VAGCSSNNDHGAGACGDGVVDSGEQCDDGNTVSGDGCSSVCKIETAGSICGDGIVDVAIEGCDDGNTVSGDGCSSDCRVEVVNPCGNGVLDTGETCDDGNTTAADGCGTTCQVEMGFMCTGSPSVCTAVPVATGTCAAPVQLTLAMTGTSYAVTAMGDTTNNTDQFPTGACADFMSEGSGRDQIFTFTNPVTQKVEITLNSHIASPTFDGMLRLTTAACDIAAEVAGNDVVADSGTPADGCEDSGGATTNEVLSYTSLGAGTYFIAVDGYAAAQFGIFSLTINAGTSTCGNGVLEFGETCDDHNTTGTDGCSATCTVEAGYTCNGAPSTCVLSPGSCASPYALNLTMAGTTYDGMGMGNTSTNPLNNVGAAACDGLTSSGGSPDNLWKFVNPVAQDVTISLNSTTFDTVLRLTSTVCDLTTAVKETIPSTDTVGKSDGCADEHSSGTAEVLHYPNLPMGTYYILVDGFGTAASGTYTFTVHGTPSTCGNGTLETGEVCDDGNSNNSDGCTNECAVATGYTCTGSPSVCAALCGNGGLDTGETCDDHNTTNGDGCDSTCHVQTGYACTGAPSVCHAIVCGDGHVDTGEACDDHNLATGDGCDGTCHVETGYACTGDPSVCTHACGNGTLDGTEECDSSGVANTRCTATCTLKFDTTETEPNNTAATAQVLTPVHQVIKGALPIGDLDVFKFTLTVASKVEIETYNAWSTNYVSPTATASVSSLGLQCNAIDTEAAIFTSAEDVTNDSTSTMYDDDDGDYRCSYVGPLDSGGDTTQGILAAGTYYFAVHEYQSNALIPLYMIDFNVTPM